MLILTVTDNLDTKVIGYMLLSIGLFVIIFSGINVYQVFTRQIPPINLFNFPGISVGLDQLVGQGAANSNASVEILPANVLNETSNLLAHLFLMGFVGGVGAKIGKLGVYMVRPINVELKSKDGQEIKEK